MLGRRSIHHTAVSDSLTPSRRDFLRQALSLVAVSAAAPSIVLARLVPDISESPSGSILATYSFNIADVGGALNEVGNSLKLQNPEDLWNLNPDHVRYHQFSLQPPRGRYPIAVTRIAESGTDAFVSVSTRCTHGDEYQIGNFDATKGYFECPHEKSRFTAEGVKITANVPGGDLRKFPTTFDESTGTITLSGVNQVAGVESDEIPARMFLDQNWPNPFVGSTMIRFGLPGDANIRLTIHSSLGQQITTLAEGRLEGGIHREMFDATGLPAGLYFYRLQTREFGTISRRLTIAR